MNRLLLPLLLIIALITLAPLSKAFAQTAATPTIFFCLGNASCGGDVTVSPTDTVLPSTEVTITTVPEDGTTTVPVDTTEPTTGVGKTITPTTEEPTVTPCPNDITESTVSVQHRHHHHHGGWVRKGMRGFLQMLIDLINKLIEQLGGTGITLPVPSDGCNPGVPTPTETPSVETPSPTEQGTFIPSVTAAITPSTAVTIPSAQVSGLLIGIGDSYTSAFGAPPYVSPNEPCYHSTSTSYVQVAAAALGSGVTTKNIACTGADTQDVQQTYGGESAQVGRVAGAKWVVMTIGGNDFDSLGSVTNGSTGPQNLINNVSTIQSNVQGVINKVKANVPGVKVFIFGYPSILPTDQSQLSASTCFGSQASNVNFALATQMYTKMNAAIKAAATATGAVYIDAPTAFVGHDMCATDNWIGRINDDDNEHPNVAGHAAMGKLLQQAIQANP